MCVKEIKKWFHFHTRRHHIKNHYDVFVEIDGKLHPTTFAYYQDLQEKRIVVIHAKNREGENT